MPDIYIIGGCNGAGKTTAAYNLLPEVFKTVEFVNADEIARGLSPFNSSGVAFQAGRIMLERLEQLIEKSQSFSFETTLSGLTYFTFISIPKDIIERRYYKGLRNFSRYATEANDWYVYDNSGSEYQLVAKSIEGEENIINLELFNIISGK